jgi:signal peptidase II
MIFIIISAVLSLDRLTKFLVTKYLILNHSVPLIKGIFHITLIHNRGAAFGILKGQIFLFVLKENRHRKSYSVSLSLILAGALSNLIDRLFLGYIIDFLDFRIWPVFNIADSAITVGAVLLGYSILKAKN